MLRTVFQTKNEMTFPVSGTGSAGMEFCFVNLIEPGDDVVVGINGVFGGRMAEVAERCGARVTKVEAEWGKIIEPDAIKAALKNVRPKIVAIVHAETSTGALTPVEEISKAAHEAGALFVLDTVTSPGRLSRKIWMNGPSMPLIAEPAGKMFKLPPGLSPVSFGPRAMQVATNPANAKSRLALRREFARILLGPGSSVYHHTAPISMNYALHEALRLVVEEGLENRWRRHQENHMALKCGLAEMGLEIASQQGPQLWQLNAVRVPAGADEAAVRKRLLTDFNIEIGAGLGPLKSKIWRVGVMGETARPENIQTFLSALKKILSTK